jgi:hypothetical protein
MKVFRIDWIKLDSGGGSEDVIANDILECLKSFYEYWGDVPKNRFVIGIKEIELSDTNFIRNVIEYKYQ